MKCAVFGGFLALLLFCFSGCSGSLIPEGQVGAVCSPTNPCNDGLECDQGLCSPVTEPGFTSPDWETSTGDNVEADAGDNWDDRNTKPELEDIDDGMDELEDVVTDASGPAGLGDFGDPCEEDLDCYSGLCAEHMGDTVCTKTCESECPAGWSCEQVILGGGDPIYLCVSLFERLCQPCMVSDDCESLTSVSACVDYGAEGSFCGASCDVDEDCPEAFVCQDAVSTRGGGSKQCVHESGVCSCSEQATALGLQTQCEVTNEYGTCSALRTCTEEGLSACDAQAAAAEVCNGVDDDCSGETDEGELCDDGNPCTDDLCEGSGGCQNVIVAQAPCDDGDPATSGDLCNALGECGGDPIECPVGVCELESVPNGESCDVTYQAAGALCDDGDPETKGDQCDGEGGCEGAPYACTATQCEATSTANGEGCDVDYWALGHPCDDGEVTTSGDQCDGQGGCSGTPYTCTPTQCETSSEVDGEGCVVAYKLEGIACDDGDPTTKGDACDGQGACAGNPYVCEPTQCEAVSTPNGQGCDVTYMAEGTACDDGDIDTKADQCDGSGGCAGAPYACTATQCEATSTANGEGCDVDYWALGHPCDDGDMATSADQCDGQGSCAGTPYVCTPSQCELSSEADGEGCVVAYKLEGIACDDGDLTTKGDACDGQGGCAGNSYTCELSQCEATATPNGLGCDVDYWAQGTACDDGLEATQDDVCDGQGGCAGMPYTCAPGLCEVSASPNGVDCDVTYALAGAACDDGESATLGDQCDGQGGCAGTPYECIPGTCEIASTPDGQGCVPSLAVTGTTCDDENPGTKDDACNAQGQCVGTPFGCSPGICELTSTPDGEGCAVTYEPSGAVCDDGLIGTQADQCDGQGGCAGTPYECTPTQCELSSTPDGSGCVVENAPASVACDDGDLSTNLDVCNGFGSCEGQPYTCAPTQCEASSTPNGQGCSVINQGFGALCDDGDPSTVGDQCDGAGQCVGTPAVCGDGVTEGIEVCDDGNQVTEQSCPYGTPNCTHCRAGCNEILNLSGAYCGDGISQSEWGEECDDGNDTNGDGCSTSCESELTGCVVLGQDVRTLEQAPQSWQQSSCQTLCEDTGGVIPAGFRIATSEEVEFLVTVLSFGSCAACGIGTCWWYGAPASFLYDGGVTGYTCTTAGCYVQAPFCYTQVLLVRDGKDGTCAF